MAAVIGYFPELLPLLQDQWWNLDGVPHACGAEYWVPFRYLVVMALVLGNGMGLPNDAQVQKAFTPTQNWQCLTQFVLAEVLGVLHPLEHTPPIPDHIFSVDMSRWRSIPREITALQIWVERRSRPWKPHTDLKDFELTPPVQQSLQRILTVLDHGSQLPLHLQMVQVHMASLLETDAESGLTGPLATTFILHLIRETLIDRRIISPES
jgi:hypothetical protein